ncbi:MaoC family dehydratase [Kytococcus sedentarius]|uniref:MaoC family dehydratase n=1 Tax=Kytococcus sedentarius TaxID=1276 RepID=UPI0035BBE55C
MATRATVPAGRPDGPGAPTAPDAGAADLEVELLDAVPSPVSLFGRALRAKGRSTLSSDDLPATRLVVPDAGWTTRELAAYARLCGYPLGGPVPSTWLHVRTFGLQMKLMTAHDFPLAVLGLVHITNRWRMHAPVAPDAEPTFTVWADGLAAHPKGVLVTLAARAEVGGDLVWEGWSDYLARGATLVGQATDQSTPGGSAAASVGSIDAASLPQRARWRFGADAGRRYAGVAGDANPIHLCAPTAKAFGFKRAIAHGMFTAARAVAALGPRVPVAHEIEVQFGKPLFLPSTVDLRASSVAPGDRPARPTELAVTAKDPSIVHMTGVVRALE